MADDPRSSNILSWRALIQTAASAGAAAAPAVDSAPAWRGSPEAPAADSRSAAGAPLGNGEQNPAYFDLNLTGMRFWTFMWLIRNEYGRVDVQMVQAWRRAHFTYDQSGVRHTHATVQGKSVPVHLLPGAATLCWHSSGPAGVDTFEGVDTYVSLSVAQDLVSFRTKGRPCEWSGPWDRLSLG